ncbi:DUF4245 family protein [Pontimonas sp.]|jgi:hypothetical protein|uniref:DUF4245 family protein n=1 Tax=Pontimonas sp. TaxID=2304492 RepID=UPI0028708CC8|nr:DUF4245 family protein [Pontimonas sp.]MDR9396225.1 DUF4245 family protein [Pontimonas sp.]MDR9434690.1 DUF4245 family protein [Pontimonas sp.]
MSSSETPEEARARKEEAKRLRRQRQNIRNLVASIGASLGIVVFLVLVVARPDETIPQAIDYEAVASQAAPSAPAELIVPELDDTWSANRATISDESFGRMWAIGLLSTTGDYVELAQVFTPSGDALTEIIGPGGSTSETTLAGSDSITWEVIDRRDVPDPGNASYALVATTELGLVVVSGTTEAGVLFIASVIQGDYPAIWG